jgi:hypothetical protein
MFRSWSSSKATSLLRIEVVLGLLLTVVVVAIHLLHLFHGGALWRDETSAVQLGLKPDLSQVLSNLGFDSFPILFSILLRGWVSLGFESDFGFRLLGLFIGLAVVAALWWNARQFSGSVPTISLLLFALSPITIRWGDSLRAYGLGILFDLLFLGLIWRLSQRRSWTVHLLASLVALLGVQSLYQNAFVVGSICFGGIVVTLLRRDFQISALIVSTGIPAALSLLPYWGLITRAREWNVVAEAPIGLWRMAEVLHEALATPNEFAIWLWVIFGLAAIAAGGYLLIGHSSSPNDKKGDLGVFLFATFAATTLSYYLFLKILHFQTETWYYLVWMAIAAVAIDALLSRALRDYWVSALRLGFAILAVAFLVPDAAESARTRMTNGDLIAKYLNQVAAKEDFILVHPWFSGVTFNRYYSGKTPWSTLPPLSDFQVQRHDLFKEQMERNQPLRPVIEKIEATLRSGHSVWVVGYLPFSLPARPAPHLEPGKQTQTGWRGGPFMMVFGMEAAYFVQSHSSTVEAIKIEVDDPVNSYENQRLARISGWRDPSLSGAVVFRD